MTDRFIRLTDSGQGKDAIGERQSDFFKKQYSDGRWNKGNQREEKVKTALEGLGFHPIYYGLGAGTSGIIIEFVFKKESAKPDMRDSQIENLFFEVSGSGYLNGLIYINPTKVSWHIKNPKAEDIFFHVCDDRNLIRFVRLNDIPDTMWSTFSIFQRSYNHPCNGFYIIPKKFYKTLR